MSKPESLHRITMDPTEPRRNIPMYAGSGCPEEGRLCRLSGGMTLEELHQWQEILRMNPTMPVSPLLTSGRQRIPLVPSPFEIPTVDRGLLPSAVAPSNPTQFCVPPQYGSSALPNANMPNMMSSHIYSGFGVLPESVKATAERSEMIHRQRTARVGMEMHAIYQQRRIEKVNPKGPAGLGGPFFYGSSIPTVPATYRGRSMLPASDPHCHRSTLRHPQGNRMLAATGPCFLESWCQKGCRLRRGSGNQKVLDSDTESSKSQVEEKILVQTHAIPCEKNEYVKGPETEVLNNQKSREANEKPTTALANTCGELEPTHTKPCRAHGAPIEAKAWDGVKKKASEQVFAACGEENGVCTPIPQPSVPGTYTLVTTEENLSLAEDIQKWTVNDVHNFISGLPGCSDYAQVFKDHAIDGETLPLLTEEHLRSTMGLKLGPALKIRSQPQAEFNVTKEIDSKTFFGVKGLITQLVLPEVSQHVENMFSKKNLSLHMHTKQAFDQPTDTPPLSGFNSWSDTSDIPCSQDIILPKGIKQDSVSN